MIAVALAWLRANILPAVIMAATAILLALVAWHFWVGGQVVKTRARLEVGQAGAQIDSGRDAVNMIANRTATESQSDAITRSNADAIQSAPGADAPVPDAVGAAGLAGLCRRAAYRGSPRCLQHAAP